MSVLARQKQHEQAHNLSRAALFQAAGITPEKLAELADKTIRKIEEKLQAHKTEIISYQGEVTAQIQLEDNAAQLRAAELAADLLGIKPSKQSGDSQGDIVVNIVFPKECQPSVSIEGNQQVVESVPLLTEKQESGNEQESGANGSH